MHQKGTSRSQHGGGLESVGLDSTMFNSMAVGGVLDPDRTRSSRTCYVVEQDKKDRRAIANNNERRRMQSINAGFYSLKNAIRPHNSDNKLSKAAILQQATDYICSLKKDKAALQARNTQLMSLLGELGYDLRDCPQSRDDQVTSSKRRKQDTESSDEGLCMVSCDSQDDLIDDLKKQLDTLRQEVDRERQQRMTIEDQQRRLGHFYAEQMQAALSAASVQSYQRPTTTSQHESAKRGNLLTIIEAIRQIEGDSHPTRMLCDDDDVAKLEIKEEDEQCDYARYSTSDLIHHRSEFVRDVIVGFAANEAVEAAEALQFIAGKRVSRPSSATKFKAVLEQLRPSGLVSSSRLVPGVVDCHRS